jgi:hypothetical protein
VGNVLSDLMKGEIKRRRVDLTSPPIKKVYNCKKPMYINYDRTGVLYWPADIDPPTLEDIRPSGEMIVTGTRYPEVNRRMQWFTSTLPVGYNNWPSALRRR